MKNYKIKICGITNERNYNNIKNYPIDYFGFIFYEKSPRYLFKNNNVNFIKSIKNKVGVFVDENINYLLELCVKYNFNVVQLHGNESKDYCKNVKNSGIKVIKSFLINSKDDFKDINFYTDYVDYFLFDYKSKDYGGSGINFNWKLLNNIEIKRPYFLSGGISLNNINLIENHNKLYAIDLNSKFEKYPGFKDIKLIDKLLKIKL
jgi:phosphoribosylanthranilate isomerase|tara:strand:+ start:1581 stop:2195 length:615 start_codon:yes stop_codon:yes gene_type:complete